MINVDEKPHPKNDDTPPIAAFDGSVNVVKKREIGECAQIFAELAEEELRRFKMPKSGKRYFVVKKIPIKEITRRGLYLGPCLLVNYHRRWAFVLYDEKDIRKCQNCGEPDETDIYGLCKKCSKKSKAMRGKPDIKRIKKIPCRLCGEQVPDELHHQLAHAHKHTGGCEKCNDEGK